MPLGNFKKQMSPVKVIKSDGQEYSVNGLIHKNMILIEDTSLPLEEGDTIVRVLPNSLEERYEVLDRGYEQRLGSIASHYNAKIRRHGSPASASSSNTVVINGLVVNSAIQSGSGHQTVTSNVGHDRLQAGKVIAQLRDEISMLHELFVGSLKAHKELEVRKDEIVEVLHLIVDKMEEELPAGKELAIDELQRIAVTVTNEILDKKSGLDTSLLQRVAESGVTESLLGSAIFQALLTGLAAL